MVGSTNLRYPIFCIVTHLQELVRQWKRDTYFQFDSLNFDQIEMEKILFVQSHIRDSTVWEESSKVLEENEDNEYFLEKNGWNLRSSEQMEK